MKRLVHSLWVGLLLAVASPADGQVATGNVYGVVTDSSGAVLPGASVTITGTVIAPRTTTAGSLGDFRFLRLDPGRYDVAAALVGFRTATRAVRVLTGDEIELAFELEAAAVSETLTIVADTPLVSTKKIGTSTTLAREELERLPQPRDPWALLRTIPGVLVSNVNVAGNTSGQQAGFVAKGSDEPIWNLDGVNVTDTASWGSPTYYDFESFGEFSVSTGGNELRAPSGGVSLNIVTKRGTNELHGAARYLLTHDALQWSNLPEELATDLRLQNPDGTFRDQADHVRQIGDYGAELGGAILRDALWFYGSYGVQDIRLVRLSGTADRTKLRSYNGKLNWQATPRDLLSLFYFEAQKLKQGRDETGAAFEDADSFLLDQRGSNPDAGLHLPGMLKLELNHVFGSDAYVNGRYSYFGSGFELVPRGEAGQPGVADFTNRTAYGSYFSFRAERPQDNVDLEATVFRNALGGTHELKLGLGYRRVTAEDSMSQSGRMLGLRFGPEGGLVDVYRDLRTGYRYSYWSGYLGDSFSLDRLTLSLGLRFDSQRGWNLPSQVVANPDFPELLPALDFDGRGTGAEWSDLSPRVGVSYALGESRRTVLRASYARYASQLGADIGNFDNPLFDMSFLEYVWADRDGDGFPSRDEVLIEAGLQYAYNVDPDRPGAIEAVNRIDPDVTAPSQQELIVGIESELAPSFALGAALTYRRTTNLAWWDYPRNGVTSADYSPDAPVTVVTPLGPFTAQSYSADPAQVEPGQYLTNQADRAWRYGGFEVTATRRLSGGWMARVAFSYNDWVEEFGGRTSYPPSSPAIFDPTRTQKEPHVDGGPVPYYHFAAIKWQLAANALCQLPWNLELSGALFARQGWPQPYFITVRQPGEPRKEVLVDAGIDTRRYPDVWNLDLRLAKTLEVGSVSLIASAELFNALNANPELSRVRDAGAETFHRLDAVLSPRVARLGLRIGF